MHFNRHYRARTALTDKIIKVMKLLPLLLTVALLQVQAASNAQITLKLDNVSLYKAMDAISKQSNTDFTFGESINAKNVKISITISHANLEEALSKLLQGTSIGWRRVNNTVVLFVLTNQPSPATPVPVDTTIGRTVVGKVYTDKGEVLIGASVRINGGNEGTVTNNTGDFVLHGVENKDILTVSFTGYTSTSEPIGNRRNFNFYLIRSVKTLDAAVVQGYGVTTQRLKTGSIDIIKAEEIARQPVMNVLQAIQGKSPGLIVTQTSGFASSPFKLELRGRSVLSGNLPSEPLIIVDNVPLTVIEQNITSSYESGSRGFNQNNFNGPAGGYSPLFSFNPDDIESISILKDADATAIYGSRGGRGVILITTKRGKAGKTKLDLNVYSGVSFNTRYYKVLNSSQYVKMRREAFTNAGIEPDVSNAYDFLIWDSTRNTDWQKVYWGKAGNNTSLECGLTGGDKNTTFRLSGSYHRVQSMNTFTGFDQRASFSASLSHKSSNQKLSIELKAMYSSARNRNISLGGGILLPPTAPSIFNEFGKLNYAGWAPVKERYIFGSILRPYDASTNLINGNLKLEYMLTDYLKLGASVGYSSNEGDQWSTVPIISQDPDINPRGSAQFGRNKGIRTILEPTLEYKNFLGIGKLEVIIGGTYQFNEQSSTTSFGRGYTNDNQLRSIAFASIKDMIDGRGQYKYAAMFGRLNYNVKDKYILTLSGRRDGSSRFGPSNKFGNFGSIAGAWIFSEENFMKKNFHKLTHGKVRISYGVTGSDIIGDYNYLSSWSPLTNFQNSITLSPNRLFNPNLQWQVDKKFEAALELALIDDRISINLAYYKNRSGNQLITDYLLPLTTGFTSLPANFPAVVQNTGFEPSISYNIIKKQDINLTIGVQGGFNRNKLISFPSIETSAYNNTFSVGKSLNIRRVLKLVGVDPNTGKYVYEDINKDGQITTDAGSDNDQHWKIFQIDFDGGFSFDFRYKNWQLNAMFHARKQTGRNALLSVDNPGNDSNIPLEMFENSWKRPGDKAKYARLTVLPEISDAFLRQSDAIYTDASFIRLNNLSLVYTITGKTKARIKLPGMKIYARAQNLITLTAYKGSDPETQAFGGLPPLTTLVGGIQISL